MHKEQRVRTADDTALGRLDPHTKATLDRLQEWMIEEIAKPQYSPEEARDLLAAYEEEYEKIFRQRAQ